MNVAWAAHRSATHEVPLMTDTHTSNSILLAAAMSSFAIALAHLGIMFMGAPGYRWFGAPGLAVQVESGSSVPAFLCIGVAALLRYLLFSLVSGVAGVLYLAGLFRLRRATRASN